MVLGRDENHHRVRMHAVARSRLRSGIALGHRHNGIHIGDLHGHVDPVGSLRVDEGADVRYTERSEDFLPRRRCGPALDIVYLAPCLREVPQVLENL